MLIVTAIVFGAAKPASEWKIPFFKARMKNPVPCDEKSVTAGKDTYIHNCQSCHGDEGKGDGPKAAELDTSPGDLSRPAMWAQSDGELFWKITDGRKPMPSHETLLTETQRWEVVCYARTLAPHPPQFGVPAPFRQAIEDVIQPYLQIGESLTKGDAAGARPAQDAVVGAASKLAAADTRDQTDEIKAAWEVLNKKVVAAASATAAAKDLDSLRTAYKDLSEALAEGVGLFGYAPTDDQIIRRFNCAKVFNETGASWLQVQPEMRNPYVDSGEAPCGALIEVYAAVKPS